ncbi:MAG: hypothetical protein V7L20_17755 [Nostoc sp.]|uniref:hypothetical protein n=1 Tax=Nostoc sp. TaxID=1180 RepID=UPI002FF8F661
MEPESNHAQVHPNFLPHLSKPAPQACEKYGYRLPHHLYHLGAFSQNSHTSSWHWVESMVGIIPVATSNIIAKDCREKKTVAD